MAAVAGLKSIVKIDEQRDGMVADMQSRIDIRGGIIDDLKKVDKNSQHIDTLGESSLQIFRDQHRDDKEMIGDLQKDLASCRSNQKWIFGAGVITGGVIVWKVKDAAPSLSSFLSQTSAQRAQFSQGYPLDYGPTSADEQLRKALKSLQK